MNYPTGFGYGTGSMAWSTDDDEAMEDEQVRPWYWCGEKGHRWADTGMKWTYCLECNAEGEWTMEHGYGPCSRKK